MNEFDSIMIYRGNQNTDEQKIDEFSSKVKEIVECLMYVELKNGTPFLTPNPM